jgi:cytochrome c oxidase assembly protein subunit 11
MINKFKSIKLAVLNIIAGIIFACIYTAQFKSNQLFVGYALLTILYIFCLVFIFLQQPKVIRYTILSIVAMLAFYDVFCDITGLNGKVDLSVAIGSKKGVDVSRLVTIEFVVNHNQEMPWSFKPQHTTITVHPGQLARTAYYAKNPTKKTMVAQAIPSISPSKASKYFRKVECFCFDSQQLGPSESANLGLQFYLDPDLPKDIKRLTLAYTLFDITDNSS